MRFVTIFIALVTSILIGCDKSEGESEFEARYKGTFVRTDGSPLNNPMAAQVTLDFTKTTFSGTSDIRNYPAICTGSFKISQSKIHVSNTCYFTADFDGTYIFDGEYNYEQSGNQMRIWKSYPNGLMDIYQLTKEE